MSSDDMVKPILQVVCGNPKVDRIYIRRWGNRNNIKVGKIISLLKSMDYGLYRTTLMRTKCGNDDCLGRVITRWIYNNLKTSIEQYYTLGELCYAVLQYNRR